MEMGQQTSMDDRFLEKIHKLIEANLGDENFRVEDLAQSAGLSRSMLHRRLKKLTGQSASDLITRKRIDHAMLLLKNDAGTASEIAYMVGFRDPSYFNKVFKKHFNISPGKVRSKHNHPQDSNTPDPGRKILWLSLILMVVIGGSLIGKIHKRNISETSIAVLPLVNLTGSAENDYFVDGLHDALIGELGKIKSLRVISTTSARQFRNSSKLLPDIAKQLGVNTLVEGSVTGIGDSLKVLIQLIDVYPKERHLFAAEYQGAMQEVVSIQKKAAQDLARHTRVRIRKDEAALLEPSSSIDPQTYRTYLRGMYYINQGTDESIQKGIDSLAGAIRRDPGDPYALAGYALGKAIQGHGANIGNAYFRSAIVSADRALTIDKSNYLAQTALALLYLYQYWDWDKAREAFESAIAVQPNNDIAQAHFAWYHVLSGDIETALYHAHQAVEIDPLSATYKSWLAWIYYYNQNYDQAEFWAGESVRINDQIPWGNLVLGWVSLEKGDILKALEFHEKLPKQALHWKWFLCRTYVLTYNMEKACAIRDEFNKDSDFWINPFYKGIVAGVLGDRDQAFELLLEACEKKYYPAAYFMSFPSAEFILEDPRCDTLLHILNLPVPYQQLAELQ